MISREKALSLLSTLRSLDESFETDSAELIDYALEWVEGIALNSEAENNSLAFLAAAKLNYLLALREAGVNPVSSFRAGDVSIGEDCAKALAAAKAVLDSALCDCEALVNLKSGFAFIGV